MTSIHSSKNGRELLDLVDTLRNIDGIQQEIPLPQIVVVGQQSSGKSSVLHAISGIRFPTNEGACTQFPTEIVLRRESKVSCQAFIRLTEGISNQRKAAIQNFQKNWSHTSLQDLGEITAQAKQVLGLTEESPFCTETLVLKVSGPDQEHLTLIDLPGFFNSTNEGQSSSDIELVNDLVKRYSERDRAIVLAVLSGKTDFECQKILEDIKHSPSLKRRTLGVITAPDEIKRGTKLETQCVSFVEKNVRNLGYGWHVLRNLTYDEMKEGLTDRDEIELKFFQTAEPWKSFNKGHVGKGALKMRLSTILKRNIAQSLPEIEKEVTARLHDVSKQLSDLGEPRQSPAELRSHLCKLAQQFQKASVRMLSSNPPDIDRDDPDEYRPKSGWIEGGDPDYSISLRQFVQRQSRTFATEMFESGSVWTLKAGPEQVNRDRHSPEYVRRVLEGDEKEPQTLYPDEVAQSLMRDIDQHPDEELSNLVHPRWASNMFQRQSRRWLRIARSHAEIIFARLVSEIVAAVQSIAPERSADRLLETLVLPALQSRKELLDAKLAELFKPYSRGSAHCIAHRYEDLVETIKLSEGPTKWQAVCNIVRSADAFHHISKEVFAENVYHLGFQSCLMESLGDLLGHEVFLKMSDEELEYFGGEAPEVKDRREVLEAEKRRFHEARDLILISSGRCWWPSQSQTPPASASSTTLSTVSPPSFSVAEAKAPTQLGDPLVARPSTPKATGRSQRSSPSANSSPSYGSRSPNPEIDGFLSPQHSRSVSSASTYTASPERAASGLFQTKARAARRETEDDY